MITERIDPPGLATIPGAANVVVATGTRIVFVAGPDRRRRRRQGRRDDASRPDRAGRSKTSASRSKAASATEADVAKLTIYVVDYSDAALEAIMTAAIEVFGEDYPITASTLVGVATLWQPDRPHRDRRDRGVLSRHG